MRHASIEWRGETIGDCDYDRPFRPRHHIHMRGVVDEMQSEWVAGIGLGGHWRRTMWLD
jgi:hypothetical protein